jgi:hypothetical protein
MTVYQWADLINGWICGMVGAAAVLVGVLIHDWVVGPHRVPHYKLRATNLLHQQGDVPEVALGSTAPSVEPQPAPLLSTRGAGTNPMTGGSAVMIGVEPPQPAPGRVRPGAGPTPPARPMASDTCPDHLPQAGREEVTTATPPISGADGDRRDVDTGSRASVSASPHQRSAAVCPPEQAAAGLPTRPGATPGGAGPSVVAADGPARAVA